MKPTYCTENFTYAFNHASRCGARTKCNNRSPCQAPAFMEVLRVVVDKRVIATHSTTMEVKSFKKAIKTAIQKATQLINRVR